MRPAQHRVARTLADVANWTRRRADRLDLIDVVENVKPTTLIGVSMQAGAFTEDVVRAMAAGCERPVIFPLSNPTSRSEARPQDLTNWTDGRALIGSGSPFPPVEWAGALRPVDQTNNSYIFPGIGLGVLAVNARRISDGMFMAAARALAAMSPALGGQSERLLPPVESLRDVAVHVAIAVAEQAVREGLGTMPDDLAAAVNAQVWEPEYPEFC